ncbi:hypothetical protein B0H17DRAFT_1076016 [Mycena rosella]|uniref:Terpenoid synthase n=1 Tax=Mycena rosella TaxID=1033263 RepID=A0AAD7D6J8_MYCRO|nr:hypothetical protein B0H17DRAFT_1076016 [Mycena rosella]
MQWVDLGVLVADSSTASPHFMLRLYDYYSSYIANGMIMSCCAFIDANWLEVRALSKSAPTKSDAKLWPYYMRNINGAAAFYAYACFPKRDHPNIVDYVQAIPEITMNTNFINDVLSFYKEEMDGEEHTYCRTMSRVTGEPPIKVLQDVADEAVAVAKRAAAILKDVPAALKTLKEYEQGNIRFYLDEAHYRLPADWKAQFAQNLVQHRDALTQSIRIREEYVDCVPCNICHDGIL